MLIFQNLLDYLAVNLIYAALNELNLNLTPELISELVVSKLDTALNPNLSALTNILTQFVSV